MTGVGSSQGSWKGLRRCRCSPWIPQSLCPYTRAAASCPSVPSIPVNQALSGSFIQRA